MTERVLEARFLGGFSLMYDGQPLDCLKTSNSQFASLLQLVLHYPEGTRQQDLQDALFRGRHGNVEDLAHAVRSVVYNANRQLELAGLPGRRHIVQKKGACSWSGQIPIQDDAVLFEGAARLAMLSDDAGQLLDTCLMYSGGFLDGCSGAIWAVSEARRYRELFMDCAKLARTRLSDLSDYANLHKLAAHAAAACPFAGWEKISVQALNAMGRHSDAMDLYKASTEKYFREQGIKLAPWQTLEAPDASEWQHIGKPLTDVMEDIRRHGSGPVLAYPSFCDLYRSLSELSWRIGIPLYFLSCTAYDKKGGLLQPGPVLDRIIRKLAGCVSSSIRKSDAACHCGGGRFLILLPDTTLEDCELVKRRIANAFYANGRSMDLRFELEPVPDPRGGGVPCP